MNRLRLSLRFLRATMRTLISSRLDYYIGTASLLVIQSISLLFLQIAFHHRTTFAGYTRGEMLLFFSVAFVIQGLSHIFCEGLWLLGPRYVIAGNLDYLLIRPFPPLAAILLAHLHSSGLLSLLFGGGLLLHALRLTAVPLVPATFATLAIYLGCGFLIHFSLVLALSSLSFRHGQINSLINIFMSLHQFLAYPLDIFPQFMLAVFTFGVPLAFVSYFPVLSLIRPEITGSHFPGELIILSFLLLFLAYGFWRHELQRYRSCGG